MRTEEIIGKTITNIYTLVKMEVGGLDTADCFVELDNKMIIDIPFGEQDDLWIKELAEDATNLFTDLSAYGQSMQRNIKDRVIVDFIWFDEVIMDKGLLLLDNGYLITDTSVAPHGTGLAGLNIFKSISDLTERRGNSYSSLTKK